MKQMGARNAGNPHVASRRGGGWKRGLVGVFGQIGAPVLDPTAVSRSAGWIAHALEQQQTGRMIRPTSRYVGVDTVPVG